MVFDYKNGLYKSEENGETKNTEMHLCRRIVQTLRKDLGSRAEGQGLGFVD